MLSILPPLRSLLRSPRYALLAIAIIAVGTGACTAVFSVFESLMLKPRAGLVAEARLADIGRTDSGAGFDNFSYPDFADYRTQNSTFDDIAAVQVECMGNRCGGEEEMRDAGRDREAKSVARAEFRKFTHEIIAPAFSTAGLMEPPAPILATEIPMTRASP